MPFYNWSEMQRSTISPQYSTAEGPTIKGTKIEVGRYRFAAGTGAKPHKHPEEQLINVVSGRVSSPGGRRRTHPRGRRRGTYSAEYRARSFNRGR